MVPYLFEVIPDMVEHMELALYPMYIGGFTLLQPWPAEENRLKIIVRPLDQWVSLESEYVKTNKV